MNWKTESGWICSVFTIALVMGTLACGEAGPEIEVAGAWLTPFDTVEVIDDEVWSFMLVVDFDNQDRWAITQNPDDDEFNPDAYNRLVWTLVDGDEFYYCTVAFGLETEAEARNVETIPDDTDLGGEGCGGFSWTRMVRQ
jgi:hypothetical protein